MIFLLVLRELIIFYEWFDGVTIGYEDLYDFYWYYPKMQSIYDWMSSINNDEKHSLFHYFIK